MKIRLATLDDFNAVQDIYAYAREQMKLSGNPNQWGDSRPSAGVVRNDILKKQSYVLAERDNILGVFAFFIGNDPTYKVIEDGKWLNDEPYGVIHKVAKGRNICGFLTEVLAFCESKIHNIRIDTHADNKIMQYLLEKNGYIKCGRIYVEDGSPRIAYQKTINNYKGGEFYDSI